MPKRDRPKSIPRELPLCDGPKLQQFPYQDAHIEWLERLGGDHDQDTPAEGYVFRAKIARREYAIKVFKFHDPMTSVGFWGPITPRDIDLNTIACYTDPFYAECRAYGGIQSAITDKKKKKKRKLSADVAVPCHGFLFLREKDEKILNEKNIDLELDRVSPKYQRATAGGYRVRAIVKDLVSSDSGVDEKSLWKVLSGITNLNRHGIFNMDIRIDNFRDGKIVDFGSSWTEPHALLDALDDEAAEEHRLTDRVMFDEMVEQEEIPNRKMVMAMHPMVLRSQD